MRKLLITLIISLIVALTCGCGSRRTDDEFDEAEAIGLITNQMIEENYRANHAESEFEEEEPVETEETEASDDDAPETVEVAVPSSSADALDPSKLKGKYTSDNGNVYSVKFYKTPEDGKVGIISVNHTQMDFKEALEIVEEDTNVYRVYETQDFFVFNKNEKDYTLAFYKDGLFADITVKVKK